MSNEQMIPVNGVELCVETFGDPADPPILLIMGAAGSMDSWEDEFCERLAAGARYVIRYDNRDTGRSVSYPPGSPAYTFDDLVEDAVGLLDPLGVQRAHVVGVSMGGAIGQALALRHPERLASLTLLSTSAISDLDRELPPMSQKMRTVFDSPPPQPEWSDRDAVIQYLVNGEEPFLGSVRGSDETKRTIAGRVFDRTTDVAASQTNHWILDGEPVTTSIAEIAAPTLVLHGIEDPMLPYEHGEALADVIPDARLIPLEGVGHEVPPRAVWNVVIPALLRHTATTSTATDLVAQLERTYALTDAVIAAIPTAQRNAPTPCEEWTVREVANHLVGGMDFFARTLEGQAPELPDPDAPDPDYLGADPAAAHRAASERCLAAFRRPGALYPEYDFPFGLTTGEVIANISLQESLVHGWDLAQGAGLPYAPDPAAVDTVARFNADTDGDDIRRQGMFGPAQPTPPGADAFAVLLARLGRRP